MKYEFLEHTSEVKFRSYGKTLEEAFENAVLALSNYISRGQKIKSKKSKKIEITGKDKKNLFYNLLEEIIILFDSENFIISKSSIKLKENFLQVKLYGDDAANYKGLDHVKSPTYSEMLVEKTKKGWVLQAVLDV